MTVTENMKCRHTDDDTVSAVFKYDAVKPASAFVYNWTVLVCIFICEPFNFNNSLNESVRIKFIPISISVFWLVTQVSNSVNKFLC